MKTLLLSLIIFTSSIVCAAEPSVNATNIVKQYDQLMQGQTNTGVYSMQVTTPQWQRTLELQVYRQYPSKTFIRILSPAKEAGITSLRIKNEMWNYLPAIEKTIKIPPSMMLQPWMGSDFTNDDLVKESSIVNDYTHTIIRETIVNGQAVYLIEALPKPNAAVIWGKIILWIRKNDFVPLKEEYYNEKQTLIKSLEYSDISQVSDRIIPKTWTMRSLIKPGHFTMIKLIDVTYDHPIDENIFSLTHLKKIE